MEKIKVVEIFSSIEGEGSLIGYPTTFIRLEGCNLRCVWCDTKYSYDTENYQELLVEDILKQVRAFKNKKVCITGGEPLYNEGFDTVFKALLKEGFFTVIETNGTLYREVIGKLFDKNKVHIVCSPKPFSGYLVNEELKPFIGEIKLVVDEFLNFEVLQKFIDFPLILQPEGNKKEFFEKAIKLQRQLLEEKGKEARVIPQVHKIFNLR